MFTLFQSAAKLKLKLVWHEKKNSI